MPSLCCSARRVAQPAWIVAITVLLCRAHSAHAAEYLVSNASQISTAMNTAQHGDVLIMTDGLWTNQHIDFAGNGNAANPITLRAQTPGGVILDGSSTLSISGNWLVADGLKFDSGALSAGQHVVRFKGSHGNANNSRLTNSAIINYNPANVDTRYFWVSLYGDNNRVDHNYFSGQNHQGVTVVDWSDGSTSNHRIDGNYFSRPAPINPSSSNGFETIRIGTSDYSLTSSGVTVENNLFEHSDGEVEIISNKTGDNTYRYNTFRDSAGTLTLRHGNNATVEGNFFLGQGKDGSGGVRVIGEDHTVINNYFANLDGRAGGAISISAGVPDSELNEYFQVRNALIAHNTIVDVIEAAITFDDGLGSSGRTLLAEDVTIANNLIRSTADALFEGNEGVGWTWEGNIAYGASLGPKAGASGITVADPMISLAADGLWRPVWGSPAIDGGSGDYSGALSDDMDGQARIGIFDVGADEFSAASIVRVPLSAGDVGPDWLEYEEPPGGGGGGCFSSGCAIEAEDFKFLTDPNGNGLTWGVIDSLDASGGKTLRAPSGSLVDPSSQPHDTLAIYDIEFSTEGVYTAYYRARGYSSGTDSIYVPGDFNTDPDVNQGLSQNGVFEWIKGQTFVINSSNVGVPLEFRIGKREQLAEFDAFVLHLDSNLSDAELDTLFLALEGDLDGDGFVGITDLNIVLGNWNQNVTAGDPLMGDPSGDGFVGIEDLNTVLGNWNAGTPPANAVPEPAAVALFAATGLWLLCTR